MKRRTLLAAPLVLGACRAGRKTIAVIPKGTSHLFWLSVQAGAYAAGREFGVEILWNGPATESEFARQVQIVDAMIGRRVDGIALAAADRQSLIDCVDRAAKKSIPVTIFDSGIDSENWMSYVATNNYEGGQIAARTLAKLIGGKGRVAMLKNAPGSLSTMDREQGFEDTIAKEFPGIAIVASEFGMSDRVKAAAAASAIFSSRTDLDGLFASSEPSSVAGALALKSRGLSGKVRFVCFDSSESMIDDLKAGTIDAILLQDAFRMGFDAVRTLVEKLRGGTPPRRVDLPARLVTRSDLNRTDVQELLSPDLNKHLPR